MKIYSINNCKNSNCNYQSKTNFKGYVNGKYYAEDVIKLAKEYIKQKKVPTVDEFKKSFFDCMGDVKVQPLEWLLSPFTYIVEKLSDEVTSSSTLELSRFALGISSLGLTELLKTPEAGIRKLVDNQKAQEKLNKILQCMLDLKVEKNK